MSDLLLWKHYLLDLPRYALTNRYQMPDRIALEQEPFLITGATYLREQLCERFTTVSDEEIARRASWVRLWRESDTYGALGIGTPTRPEAFRIEGRHHLEAERGSAKPVFMLTSHSGSFYFSPNCLASHGFKVFPVARSVDKSAATPKPTQRYLELNYKITERGLNNGHYLYTDYDGRFDRKIIEASRQAQSIILNLIDMPPTLYGGRRADVFFLGDKTPMPINFIQWAYKKKGKFLLYWSGYDSEFNSPDKPRQYIHIEPVRDASSPEAILQEYARHLEAHIATTPWNWMALPIASQYHPKAT